MPCITFVCQAGEIEAQALLLAASIRARLDPAIELVAAHPPAYGSLRGSTEQALSDLAVRVIPIRNPLAACYPIGNKFAALPLSKHFDTGIFLDSDMIAMRRPESWPQKLSMVPALDSHHNQEVWDHVYRKFGLTIPSCRAPTLISRDKTAPYFNAGMIAAPGDLVERLAQVWIETARQIDDDVYVPEGSKRPFLDQLSLPVAALRLGLEIMPLGLHWNLVAWKFRMLEGRDLPYFFHYQHWERLIEAEASRIAVREAANILPSIRRALDETLRGQAVLARCAGSTKFRQFPLRWQRRIINGIVRIFGR